MIIIKLLLRFKNLALLINLVNTTALIIYVHLIPMINEVGTNDWWGGYQWLMWGVLTLNTVGTTVGTSHTTVSTPGGY